MSIKQRGHASKSTTTPVSAIFARNILTIFNFVNLILAFMIILVHSYENLLFLFVAIFNTAISIINELRAKRVIDKLSLISERKQTIIKNGKTHKVSSSELEIGDQLVLNLGSQLVVDAKITEGAVEVNESFITGESDNITKQIGDPLLSGSFVVAGSCVASVTAVGDEVFINKLAAFAKTIKPSQSKLFLIMNNIVKYISYALIPIGILLLLARFRVADTTTEVAVTSTVAALISMIPEGLILLTSSVLALASIRLANKKVLVQDLYSIETLARVDTICLDKTGTLTSGKMTVKSLIPAKNHSETDLLAAVDDILSAIPADNATSKALELKLQETAKNGQKSAITGENLAVFLKNRTKTPILGSIPFSSERKYSGIKVAGREILMGAPEFVANNPNLLSDERELLKNANISPSDRILAVINRTKTRENLIGFITLEDEIRHNAPQIIQFFAENDVAVKVISGDSIETVSAIAAKVGLTDIRAIDLSAHSDHDYKAIVSEYNVFTRVKPAEKKSLIAALRQAGHTVAMTGDGVNDVLAMKESDCSIAIGDGTDAARRVARLVLLKSDFSTITDIIAEGRQTINNLERSTTLFLSKTVYASVLAVIFTILPLLYPFIPIEMSLLNFTCIGFPAFILALEVNHNRIKDQFVSNIIKFSIPTGLTVVVNVILLTVITSLRGLAQPEIITISAITTFAINLMLIYKISRPLNPLRATTFALVIVIMAAVFLITPIRNFFGFVIPSSEIAIIIATLIVISVPIFLCLSRLVSAIFRKKL